MHIFAYQLLIACVISASIGAVVKRITLQETTVAPNVGPTDFPENSNDWDPNGSSTEKRPSETPAFVPKPGLARLIDDIFQIPIGVLQSVARLLTNPLLEQRHQQKKDPEFVNRKPN